MSLLEREHLALLLKVNEILSWTMDIEELLEKLMDQIQEVLAAERCLAILREGDGWRVAAARSIDPDNSYSRNMLEGVAEKGEPLICLDAMQDPVLSNFASITVTGVRSVICAPIIWGGEVKGAVYADHRVKSGVFREPDLELLVAIAHQAARALENAALYAEVRRLHKESMEEARRELAQTQAQLFETAKLAAVGQLAAGIAHEVNNPLCALALNLTTVAEKIEDPALEKPMALMEVAVNRCRDIVERLLRFAHPSKAERQDFRLDETVQETVELVRHQLKKAEIQVEMSLEAVVINGDPAQLGQVFLNLLMNARDAMKEGGRLALGCRAGGGQAIVTIADTGTGMSEEVRNRLFEPFFTTKEVGEGYGLGLSVSYQILKEHGATVVVDSKEGRGSTFTITFPRDEECALEF